MDITQEVLNDLTVSGFIISLVGTIISIIGFVLTIIVMIRTKNIREILNRKEDIKAYNASRKDMISSLESSCDIIIKEKGVSLLNRNNIIKQITKISGFDCISKEQKKLIEKLSKLFDSKDSNNYEQITVNINKLIGTLDRGIRINEY